MIGLNCYVVSYDVMDHKRLYRVHKTMKGFGDPIHYSVFRCSLTPKGKVVMLAALSELIKHDEDRVMVIDMGPLEGKIDERIDFLGVYPGGDERKAIVV